MKCFYHQDKDGVGLCKGCQKCICADCAVDLGNGIACKNRCEELARSVIQLWDRSIESLSELPKVEISVPQREKPIDYTTSMVSNHLASHRRFRTSMGTFHLVIGFLLLAVAYFQENLIWILVASGFIVFGIKIKSQPEIPSELKPPNTQTW